MTPASEATIRALIREALELELDEGKGLADNIVQWAKRHDDLSVEYTAKGHIKVRIEGHGDKKGKSEFVVASGTASDYRSDLNFRSMMKKKLRDLGWSDDEIKRMPR